MKTLKNKFLVFILIPVFVTLLGLAIWNYWTARNLLLEEMRHASANYLWAQSDIVAGAFERIQTVNELLALQEMISQNTDAQRRRLLEALEQRMGKSVNAIFMGFPDGDYISSAGPAPPGYDPRLRPWFMAALALPEGNPAGMTNPYTDARTGRLVFTAYRKIITDDGSLLGVLGIDIDTAKAIRGVGRYMLLPPDGQIVMVNANARILLHPDNQMIGRLLGEQGEPADLALAEEIRQSETIFGHTIGRRHGATWYLGFHRIGNTGLSYVLMIPAHTVLKPLNYLAVQVSSAALVVVVGLLVLLAIMSRRITLPILKLKASAVRVARGGSYQDPLQVKTSDEVGELTTAFNAMMAGLRQRDFIRDTFGRYVTKEVVDELLETPEGLRLGGEMREVTIMFSDIRGFTPLSEHLQPTQVIAMLNRYLACMDDVIARYHGTVNEFIGDAILTIFGAPVKRPDHPLRCVACAVAMQLAMTDFNRQNHALGLPPLFMGIGINTGEAIVGNIGSENRAKYGVVGHHINLTSRIESVTNGGQILISPSTYDRVKEDVIVGETHSVSFKGVEGDVLLHEVLGVEAAYNLRLPPERREPARLDHPMGVGAHRMQGKQVEGLALGGELTHFSMPWARAILETQIPAGQEIRLDLDHQSEGSKAYLYARVAAGGQTGTRNSHLVRVSFLLPAAAALLRQRE